MCRLDEVFRCQIQPSRARPACAYGRKRYSYYQVKGQRDFEYSALQFTSEVVDVLGAICGD